MKNAFARFSHTLRGYRRHLDRINVERPPRLNTTEIARLKQLPKNQQCSVDLGGRRLLISDPYWFLHTYQEIMEDEIYRFRTDAYTPLIIDCGANVGLSVIYFKYLYPESRIIAFEPDPSIFSLLSTNLKPYDFSNITLNPEAVWTAKGSLLFQPDGSVGGRVVPVALSQRSITVNSVRLRDFLDQEVQFLKIDIEGAEYEVLKDCQDRLANVDQLFVEYHGSAAEDQTLDEMLRILRLARFRYHVKEAWPIAHPFIKNERRTLYDLQLNIFAFRS